MYETQSQFGKVEEGRLNESLFYECANLPGNLFTVMTSHMGVVTPTNGAMPKLSPWKIQSQNLEQFCKYDQKYNT